MYMPAYSNAGITNSVSRAPETLSTHEQKTYFKELALELHNKSAERSMLSEMIKCLSSEIEMYQNINGEPQDLRFLEGVMGDSYNSPEALYRKLQSLITVANSHRQDLVARMSNLDADIHVLNQRIDASSLDNIDEVISILETFSDDPSTVALRFKLFQTSSRVINNESDLLPGMHVFCYRFGPISHHGVCILDSDGNLMVVHLNGGVQTAGSWVRSHLSETFLRRHKINTDGHLQSLELFKSGQSVAYVQPVTIKEFSAGDKIHVGRYKYEAPYELTAARAMKAIWSGQYNLISRNCEHFATWCKTGCGVSIQINNVASAFVNIGQYLRRAQTRCDDRKTSSALSRMPSSVLRQVARFADVSAKKFNIDRVNFLPSG